MATIIYNLIIAPLPSFAQQSMMFNEFVNEKG
jgi:hypothetical protein